MRIGHSGEGKGSDLAETILISELYMILLSCEDDYY
jgi:hypothetical protein